MKLRILAQADCRAALDMAGAIEAQAQAFRLLAQGRSVQGLRSFVTSETPPGVAIFNPAFLRGGAGYGIKVISDFYDNDKRGLARMSGLVCLFDGTSGHPRAVLEAGYLTDLRTGAGTALAARYLARGNSRVLALIGAGRVARNQLAALAEVFALETVFLSTRSNARALKACSPQRNPPTKSDRPRTSRRLPTIEPIKEALTTSKFPAAMSRTATINSVRFPNVALSSPPSCGPTRIASWSVARPISPASGTMASAAVTKVSNG